LQIAEKSAQSALSMLDINDLLDKAITDWLSNEEKKL